jgi:integration host factor subunit alpha
MTKADIAERIQVKTGYSRKDSADMLELVLNVMKDTLESGETIMISGFGKFDVKQKNDRKGRNPQTGEDLTIDARRVLKFKPSLILKSAINVRSI